jgi:RNA polymerase sigma-70 factor (ECF subfamily)
MDCTLHLAFVHQPRFEIPGNGTKLNPRGVDIVSGPDPRLLQLLRVGGIAQGPNFRQDGMQAVLRSMVRSSSPSQLASDEPDGGDGALVRAARGGDRRACQAIWKKYAPLVQRLVRRFFGPGPDHPDICQEAFMRVFKRMDELREPAALPGFIVGVTLGVARNESRRRRIRAIVGLNSSDEWPGTVAPGAADEAREAVRALYRLLDTLGAEDRSLFVARYVEKMEMTDVAAAHKMSLSTVKRRLARLAQRVDSRMKSEPALADYVGLLSQGGTS